MLRSITYTSSAWRAIEAQCRAAPDRETGWRQLGIRVATDSPDGTHIDLVTFAVVGEGPNARAGRASFAPDVEYQQAEIDRLTGAQPHWRFLAEGHLHPPYLSTPSAHDVRMAAEMALEPCYGLPNTTMPIVIATLRSGCLCLRAFAVDGGFEPPEVYEIQVLVDGQLPPEPPTPERMLRRSVVGSLLRRLGK